jgi:hypothetical protein
MSFLPYVAVRAALAPTNEAKVRIGTTIVIRTLQAVWLLDDRLIKLLGRSRTARQASWHSYMPINPWPAEVRAPQTIFSVSQTTLHQPNYLLSRKFLPGELIICHLWLDSSLKATHRCFEGYETVSLPLTLFPHHSQNMKHCKIDIHCDRPGRALLHSLFLTQPCIFWSPKSVGCSPPDL